jgi:tripartite-type tricarboxylate transporter receptor subunit TctC
LNAELMNAMQSLDVRQKLALQGAEPLGSTPEAYGKYSQKELTRWVNKVKQTGVTLE